MRDTITSFVERNMKRAIALFALFLGCIGLFAQESMVERLERELAEARAENAALRGQVPYRYETPERAPGQENVLGLRVAPIRNVRAAFIGCGARGGLFLRILSNFPDRVTIKAAADLYQEKLDAIDRELKEKGYPYEVFYTTDPDGWREICERDDIDMVFIATPPNLHLPIAVWAMEHGKHVAVEVPVVHNVQEAWKLVDTAERTRRHCVMLENCIYGDYELAIKNMVDLGLFGETIHAEGGYLHNLEEYRFDYDDKTNWRTERPTRGTPRLRKQLSNAWARPDCPLAWNQPGRQDEDNRLGGKRRFHNAARRQHALRAKGRYSRRTFPPRPESLHHHHGEGAHNDALLLDRPTPAIQPLIPAQWNKRLRGRPLTTQPVGKNLPEKTRVRTGFP